MQDDSTSLLIVFAMLLAFLFNGSCHCLKQRLTTGRPKVLLQYARVFKQLRSSLSLFASAELAAQQSHLLSAKQRLLKFLLTPLTQADPCPTANFRQCRQEG